MGRYKQNNTTVDRIVPTRFKYLVSYVLIREELNIFQVTEEETTFEKKLSERRKYMRRSIKAALQVIR